MDNISISQAVIGRLPRYYRYLGELNDEGVSRISSRELSELMHVTASQIRADLNHFGGFGQVGYGLVTLGQPGGRRGAVRFELVQLSGRRG